MGFEQKCHHPNVVSAEEIMGAIDLSYMETLIITFMTILHGHLLSINGK
jgi:hypothetical protein